MKFLGAATSFGKPGPIANPGSMVGAETVEGVTKKWIFGKVDRGFTTCRGRKGKSTGRRLSTSGATTIVNIEITFPTQKDLIKTMEMGFQEGFTMAQDKLDEYLAARAK